MVHFLNSNQSSLTKIEVKHKYVCNESNPVLFNPLKLQPHPCPRLVNEEVYEDDRVFLIWNRRLTLTSSEGMKDNREGRIFLRYDSGLLNALSMNH